MSDYLTGEDHRGGGSGLGYSGAEQIGLQVLLLSAQPWGACWWCLPSGSGEACGGRQHREWWTGRKRVGTPSHEVSGRLPIWSGWPGFSLVAVLKLVSGRGKETAPAGLIQSQLSTAAASHWLLPVTMAPFCSGAL